MFNLKALIGVNSCVTLNRLPVKVHKIKDYVNDALSGNKPQVFARNETNANYTYTQNKIFIDTAFARTPYLSAKISWLKAIIQIALFVDTQSATTQEIIIYYLQFRCIYNKIQNINTFCILLFMLENISLCNIGSVYVVCITKNNRQ